MVSELVVDSETIDGVRSVTVSINTVEVAVAARLFVWTVV